MPSFRRLASWYGYSFKHLYTIIDKQSPEEIANFIDADIVED